MTLPVSATWLSSCLPFSILLLPCHTHAACLVSSLQGSSEPWTPLDNSFGAVWQSLGALPQPPFDVQITPASGAALIAQYACWNHEVLACRMGQTPVSCIIISEGAPSKPAYHSIVYNAAVRLYLPTTTCFSASCRSAIPAIKVGKYPTHVQF